MEERETYRERAVGTRRKSRQEGGREGREKRVEKTGSRTIKSGRFSHYYSESLVSLFTALCTCVEFSDDRFYKKQKCRTVYLKKKIKSRTDNTINGREQSRKIR